MGNGPSLRVDYGEALNQSFENHPRQQSSATPTAMATGRRDIGPCQSGTRHKPSELTSDRNSLELKVDGRLGHSLPDLTDETLIVAGLFESGCSRRDRCKTISQPIRIPIKKHDPKKLHSDAQDSRPSTDARPVYPVNCEDIVIHYDPIQAPQGSRTTQLTGLSLSASPLCSPPDWNLPNEETGAHKRRRPTSSTSPDFMIDFRPLQGEKIKTRERHFSIGLDDLSPSSSSLSHPHTGFGHALQPKRGESLISFLKNVNMSSSSLELERENAHFTICQGLMCAIEQLKWNAQLKKMRLSGEQQQQPDLGETASTSISDTSDGDEDGSATNMDSELMSVSTSNLAETAIQVEAEWGRETNTAEEIGLNLLAQFNERLLPSASDINWLAFDGASFFTKRDGHTEGSHKVSFCRGTNDWAPPRAQIIFSKRVSVTSRKQLLQQQNYRCRGCGSHVSVEYSSKYRLCEYFGQYFCTGCHRNQMATIPARVLHDWNFRLYPVTVFAYRLIEEMWHSPLFHVPTINPGLYRVSVLDSARKLRAHFRLARDHVLACRFAQEDQIIRIFQNVPDYFTDPDLFAMADFVAVKRGQFEVYLRSLIQHCDNHLKDCELCLARGYLCEICHGSAIIFPWHPQILQCPDCGACAHKSCWTGTCPKCFRIRLRK